MGSGFQSERIGTAEIKGSVSEALQPKKEHVAFEHLIKTQSVDHCIVFTHLKWTVLVSFYSPAFSFTCSPSPTRTHLTSYTPFATTPITQSCCYSTLPNFLLCCLPGSLFILLAIFLSFTLAPSQRARGKMFPEKRIIIICGSALESNVLES